MKALEIFKKREFFHSSLMAFTNFFVGGVNFLFHMVMQRMLGPDNYGIVYPLINISLFITLIATTFQFIITKETSILIHENRKEEALSYTINSLKLVFFITLFFILIYLPFIPILKNLLKINNTIDFIYLLIITIFPFFTCIFVALLQARENFMYLSITQIFPTIVKFLAGFLFLYFTGIYAGFFMAFIAGNVFTLILLMIEFYKFKNNTKIPKNYYFDRKKFFDLFLYTFPAISGFTILSNIDSIIVRANFPELSGVYSSVSSIGKASFYIAISISTVFLPILSKTQDLKKSNRRALIFLSIFLGLFITIVFLSSSFIGSFILKNRFIGFDKFLPYYCIVYIPFAYISYLVNYYVISKNKIYVISIIIAIILQIIGIRYFAKDLNGIANVVGLTGFLVLIILLIEARFQIFVDKKSKLKDN